MITRGIAASRQPQRCGGWCRLSDSSAAEQCPYRPSTQPSAERRRQPKPLDDLANRQIFGEASQ
jgi:hypothetical protein